MTVRLKVIEKHEGEGLFPLFAKGAIVKVEENCQDYGHWLSCEIDGYKTYVFEYFIKDGRLLFDYNPTELVADVGTELVFLALYGDWVRVENPATKEQGWFPAEKLISI